MNIVSVLGQQLPLHPTHAYTIAFILIMVVISVNTVNHFLLKQKVYHVNERLKEINKDLTHEIEKLKNRLHKWEQDC